VPRWAAFVGLTVLVLTFFLALARLSQSLVRDDGLSSPLPDDESPDRTDAFDDEDPSPAPADDAPEPSADGAQAAGTVEATEPGGDGGPTYAGGSVESPYPEQSPADRTLGPTGPEFGTATLLVNVALTQGLVGVVLLVGVVHFEIPLSALGVTGDPWVAGLPALGMGLAFGVALWLGNEVAASVADAVGAAYDEKLREMLAPDSTGGWLVLLAVVLPTIAFVEELLFRAALVGVIHAGFGVSAWLMAVLSSIVFALGHGAQGRVGIAVTGVLGLVLAGGFVVTGSLLVVVVAHYAVNALEFVVHEWLGASRLGPGRKKSG